MMLKSTTTFIFYILLGNGIVFGQEISPDSAQKLVALYKPFLKSDTIDLAQRKVTKLDEKFLKVEDRYPGGNLASIRFFYDVNSKGNFGELLELDGSTFFYNNGQVKKNSHLTEEAKCVKEYFRSGLLYREYDLLVPYRIEVKSVRDPIGTLLVEDFVGNSVELNYLKDQYTLVNEVLLLEIGSYKNFARNGKWTGYFESGEMAYSEIYLDKDSVTGKSWDQEKREFAYNTIFKEPEFKGGKQTIYQFLEKKIKYSRVLTSLAKPKSVKVRFIVTEDGKVTDITNINEAPAILATEAFRVIKETDGLWTAAQFRGKPVDAYYTISVLFAM